MKQTTVLALLLTFFSFLLILSAALLFLWQGRQTLQATVSQLQTEQNQLQDQQLLLKTELETQSAQFESARVENEGLEELLGTRTVLIGTLTAEKEALTSPTVTPAVSTTMPALSPPLIQFVRPISGTRLEIGKPVEIIVSAMDKQGIAQIEVREQEAVIELVAGESKTLQVAEASWTPISAGTYTLTAIVTNTQGVSGVPAQILVTVSSVGDAYNPDHHLFRITYLPQPFLFVPFLVPLSPTHKPV